MNKLNLYKTHLKDRDLVEIEGKESLDFLQNLITNDTNLINENKAIYSALLTPQGKYLFDFILFLKAKNNDKILIDCEKARSDELIKTFNLYKLRKKVTISKLKNIKFYSIFGSISEQLLSRIGLKNLEGYSITSEENVAFFDPRNKNLGIRIITFNSDQPRYLKNIPSTSNEEWDLNRIALIDKLILRMSLSEMLYIEEVPPKVSITEGVEIAKEFSTNDSSRFVNGILDSIYNDLINGKIKL